MTIVRVVRNKGAVAGGGGGTPTTLGEDWELRSTGAGVKWATDFSSDAEVTKFIIDEALFGEQGFIFRNVNDGIAGAGCLQITTLPGDHTSIRWARPFSALPGDVGYVSGPDISANWNSNGDWKFWERGYYGHSTYHSDGAQWDGTEFYIQARIKMSASCLNFNANSSLSNYETGKLCFIDGPGGNDCELVQQEPYIETLKFNIYTNFGRAVNNPMAPPSTTQFPVEEWVTVLWHVKPGLEAASTSIVEAWFARHGETSYTKLWDVQDADLRFDPTPGSPDHNGYNEFMISNYMNGNNANGGGFYRRWGQIIFSTQSIPCPQVYTSAPAWFENMADDTWTQIAGGASFSGSAYQKGARLQDVGPSPALAGTGVKPNVQSFGSAGLDQRTGRYRIYGGGHFSYYGNEVYGINLRDDVPAWTREIDPSPGAESGASPTNTLNSDGQYAEDIGVNGYPEAFHSQKMIWADGKLWLVCPWGSNGSPTVWTSFIFSYDSVAGAWTKHGRVIPSGESGYQSISAEYRAVVFIDTLHEIWSCFGNVSSGTNKTLFKINTQTNTITSYTQNQVQDWWNSTGVGIPGTRYALIKGTTVQNGTGGLHLFDAANPLQNLLNLSVDDQSGTTDWKHHFYGIAWLPREGGVAIGNGNEEDWFLAKPTIPGIWAGEWTVTRITPDAANTVTPANFTSGATGCAFGRWQVIDDMGNGQSAIVMLPEGNGTGSTDAGGHIPLLVYKVPL